MFTPEAIRHQVVHTEVVAWTLEVGTTGSTPEASLSPSDTGSSPRYPLSPPHCGDGSFASRHQSKAAVAIRVKQLCHQSKAAVAIRVRQPWPSE